MGKVIMSGVVPLLTEPAIYKQVVNYTMLYDSGDECTALTGGWERYGYNSGVFQKNSDHIYATGVGNAKNTNGFGTTSIVSRNGHSKLNVIISCEHDVPRNGQYHTQWDVVVSSAKFGGNYDSSWEYVLATLDDGGYDGDYRVHNSSWIGLTKLLSGDMSAITSFYPTVQYSNWGVADTYPLSVYSVFMTKADDWQTLADKAGVSAGSMADLIANAETLLSNKRAIDFMVYNCTGDFMVSALQSETFCAALNASPNKDRVAKNEHWAKFMRLLGLI